MNILIVVALLLLAVAIVLMVRSREMREVSGLPPGAIIYQDTVRTEREIVDPLFSRAYLLAGKPDYLVEEDGEITPVEVKSGRAPAQPYESHVMQLAAYCLLVSDLYGRRPRQGIIRYADRQFEVPYTVDLEDKLLHVMDAMRLDIGAEDVQRSHEQPGRCFACSFRDMCGEALV